MERSTRLAVSPVSVSAMLQNSVAKVGETLASRSLPLRSAKPLVRLPARRTFEIGVSLFSLEKRSRQFRLPNDACQRTAPQRTVERHGNRDRRCLQLLLHDPMTASLTDRDEAVLFENSTHFQARKNPELTQPAPRPGLQRLSGEPAGQFPAARPSRKTASRLQSGSLATLQWIHPGWRYQVPGITQRIRRSRVR